MTDPQAEISTEPDLVTVTLSVEEENAELDQAQAAARSAAEKVGPRQTDTMRQSCEEVAALHRTGGQAGRQFGPCWRRVRQVLAVAQQFKFPKEDVRTAQLKSQKITQACLPACQRASSGSQASLL